MNQLSINLKNYYILYDEYHLMLKMISGTGNRYQNDIDTSYNKLIECYNSLTEEEKSTIMILPIKEKVIDDGYNGILSGLALQIHECNKNQQLSKSSLNNGECNLQ